MTLEDLGQTPYNSRTKHAKARAVLILLGFSNMARFARYAGISTLTCSQAFSDSPKYPQNLSVLSRVYEALLSTFNEKSTTMPPDERRFVKGWIDRWAKSTSQRKISARPARQKKDDVLTEIEREKRRRRDQTKFVNALKALE